MKLNIFLLLVIFLGACTPSEDNSTPVPSQSDSGGAGEASQPQKESIKKLVFNFQTDKESVEILEVKLDGSLQKDTLGWIKVSTKSLIDKSESESLYEVLRTGLFEKKDKLSQVDYKKALKKKVTSSLTVEGREFSFEKIQRQLSLSAYFDLYRCRTIALGKVLAQQTGGFLGDWHIRYNYSSLFENGNKIPIFKFYRNKRTFDSIVYVDKENLITRTEESDIKEAEVILNLPSEKYFGVKELRPRRGKFERFRWECDEYYGRKFPGKDEFANLDESPFVTDYLPPYDRELELKFDTVEITLWQLPNQIANPFAVRKNSMEFSDESISFEVNRYFYDTSRFPVDKVDVEDDELYYIIKGEVK